MRSAPTDDGESKDLAELNAAPWMVAALSLNPNYTSWGPDEDYMIVNGSGWNSPMRLDAWSDRPGLDDLNEVANFYFEIRRESRKCDACTSGYSPRAQRISDEWYGNAPFDAAAYGSADLSVGHQSIQESARRQCERTPDFYGTGPHAIATEARRLFRHYSSHWCHRLIQADVDALVTGGRLRDLTRDGHHPTADEVNAWSMAGGFGHDAINHWICVRARCEREGVAVECPACNGTSHIYTAPAANLALIVWLLHPRKGASRGVEIKRIEESEMPDVLRWLASAAERNAQRFADVVAASAEARP